MTVPIEPRAHPPPVQANRAHGMHLSEAITRDGQVAENGLASGKVVKTGPTSAPFPARS